MKDVTNVLQRYRECVRHVWNTYFYPFIDETVDDDVDGVGYDVLDTFDEIERVLFFGLVLEPLNKMEYRDDFRKPSSLPVGTVELDQDALMKHISSVWSTREPHAVDCLQVIPKWDVPILISREKSTTGYWDHPICRTEGQDIDLRFIDYFDWGQESYWDLQYFRVKIMSFPAHPEVEGREALIEVLHCQVFLREEVREADTAKTRCEREQC